MNKNVQTCYLPVSVNTPPDDEEYRICFIDGKPLAVHIDYKPFDSGVTHWLSEQQGVVLSVEEWEKVQKCIEIIQELAITEKISECRNLIEKSKQLIK